MYRRELAINQELAKADPRNPTRERNVMVGHVHVADALRTIDPVQALAEYRLVLPIADKMAQADPGDMSALSDQALMYERVGALLVETQKLDEGVRMLRRSLELLQPVAARDDTSLLTKARLASAEKGLGLAFMAYGRDRQLTREARVGYYRDATRSLERARTLWREISEKSPVFTDEDNLVLTLKPHVETIERELAALE